MGVAGSHRDLPNLIGVSERGIGWFVSMVSKQTNSGFNQTLSNKAKLLHSSNFKTSQKLGKIINRE